MKKLILPGLVFLSFLFHGTADDPSQQRVPSSEEDLRFWLENMKWHHHFSTDEIQAVTGLSPEAIEDALARFDITEASRPEQASDDSLHVLPYPGGRHPRIGFLEGAVDPQRDTKISVFLPWNPDHYVVADIPEALWSNLGLTYLAHTHIPTIWENETLPPQEWERLPEGVLKMERHLPNGIVFGTEVTPQEDGVVMRQWLINGTDAPLTDLRVQNCVMLKAAPEFAQQTDENKVASPPFIACHSEDRERWIITAWEPCDRTWANPPVPCLHSDPKFPDCPPGEERELHGWLSFYQGTDIEGEFEAIRKRWQIAREN